MKKYLQLLFIIVFAFISIGLVGLGYPLKTPLSTNAINLVNKQAVPLLLNYFPAANTHTVPRTTAITLTYNEAISVNTVNKQTVALYAMQTGGLSGTYTVNGASIILTPVQPFKAGELIQVTATTMTLNLSGQGAIWPTVWQFRTEVEGGSGIFMNSGQNLGISNTTIAVALGDVDNDGDLDAFTGNYFSDVNKLWFNNGWGIFSDSGQTLGNFYAKSIALGDLDGDGDLDAFIANDNGDANTVWLNQGGIQGGTLGIFSDSLQTLGTFNSRSVALGDLDGDGDLDAFVANNGQPNKIWLNNGLGIFIDSPPALGTFDSEAVALGDVDNDGDLDAFVANINAQNNKLWLNNGQATFNDSLLALGNADSEAIDLGDLDNDGDLDAFVGNYNGQPNEVWFNNGLGVFSNSLQALGILSSTTIALSDADADGDLDAIVINYIGGPSQLWLNNGTGIFSDSGQTLGNGFSIALAVGDVDNDGDTDIFIGNDGQENQVWLNRNLVDSVDPLPNTHIAPRSTNLNAIIPGVISQSTVTSQSFVMHRGFGGDVAGTFMVNSKLKSDSQLGPGRLPQAPIATNPLSLCDNLAPKHPATTCQVQGNNIATNTITFNPTASFHPGELIQTTITTDIIASNAPLGKPFVWQFRTAVQGGSGYFFDSGQDLTGIDDVVAIGDLDDDGDLDIINANGNNWFNNGSGIFTMSNANPGSANRRDIALGDLDNDGDLDAFVTNLLTTPNQIWLNDGNGIFSDSGQNLGSLTSEGVDLGDVDGDGDLDAVIANNGSIFEKVWLNNGTGIFSDSGQSLNSLDSDDIAVADFDSDGDLDIFVADSPANTVWFNDGKGIFTDSGQLLGSSSNSNGLTLGDVDNDGDIDVFVMNFTDQAEKLWLNNGQGVFTDSGQIFDNPDTIYIALGDLDADGDLDAFFSNEKSVANEIWLNNGNGIFAINQFLGNSHSNNVNLGDFDNDGDLDALVINNGQPSKIWLNQIPPALSISKSGPATAVANSLITYTLHITNSGEAQATNLSIADVLPTNATYISSAGGTNNGQLIGNVISWTVPTLNGYSSISLTLIVTATQNIVNNSYAVSADGGLLASGTNAVSTSMIIPVNKLTLNGPSKGNVGQLYLFNVNSSPITATIPITYSWQTDQSNQGNIITYNNGIATSQAFSWPSTGTKIITVTAINGHLPVIITHSILITKVPNTPPVAYNVSLTPISPTTMQTLTFSYQYTDADYNPEGNTRIYWTRDGRLQPALTKKLTVPHRVTISGERWCATVQPHDGTDYGDSVEKCVNIQGIPNNRPPYVISAILTPPYPVQGIDSLTLTTSITDADKADWGNLSETINWFKNGHPQPQFHNQYTISNLTAGQTWCAKVTPYDDKDYGATQQSNCIIINPPTNALPEALDVAITPATPFITDTLSVVYTYTDRDGDLEVITQTQIRWYRQGQLQPGFNNRTTIPPSALLAGEEWLVSVRPFDGKDYGQLINSEPVFIIGPNTPPVALNVQISPLVPTGIDNLKLSYTFLDGENDKEGNTQIYWFKNLVWQTAYNGFTTIPAAQTAIGDIWFAKVVPHDESLLAGDGIYAHSRKIVSQTYNLPPTIKSANIVPANPCADAELNLIYDFFDPEGNPEGATEIYWLYGNSGTSLITRTYYNNQATIKEGVIVRNELWIAKIKPHDGSQYGGMFSTTPITVSQCVNNAPTLKWLYVDPAEATTQDKLEVLYEYSDADGNSEGDTFIKWFRDDVEIITGQTFISSTATSPGEEWYAAITPHDGLKFGLTYSTDRITINRPPTLITATISPTIARSAQALTLYPQGYADLDLDPPIYQVNWYRNGILQPVYSNSLTIPANVTQFKDTWYAWLRPYDGKEYGNPITTTIITILPSNRYIPIILKNHPQPIPTPSPMPVPTPTATPTPDLGICSSMRDYENNDERSQACGALVFSEVYTSYPEDMHDLYYYELTETSSVKVTLNNYTGKGKLVVYYNDERDHLITMGTHEGGTNLQIPNSSDEKALKDGPPGRYYIYIYTEDNFNSNSSYQLSVNR